MKQRNMKMFKKTLLALALASVAASATAATITTAPVTYSAEGIVNELLFDVTADTYAPVVALGISNGYQIGDKVVFTFTNDTFDISSSAALVQAGTVAPTATFGAPVYSNGNTVSFTINALGGGDLTLANLATLTLNGIVLTKTNLLAGGSVNVDYKVISSVNGTDYEAKSAKIAEAKTELSASVTTKLDGVIDVNALRTVFAAGNLPDLNNDAMVITPVDAGYVKSATVTKTVYTVNGDFSFMDTDSDGTADYAVTVTGGTSITAQAFATDFQSLTFTDTGVATAVNLNFEATDSTTVIPAQAYTAKAVVSYTPATGAATSKTFDAMAAGSWTLNGASAQIPYMPYAATIDQIIYVTNTSKLDGEVEVVVTAEDGTKYNLGQIAVAKPGVTKLSGLIKTALAAQGFTTGKTSIEVIVNAPNTSVTVYAAYNVGGADRGYIAVK
jgi:hypothetical protein